jgi:hypothetical protein
MTRREAFKALLGLGVAATQEEEKPKPPLAEAWTVQWTVTDMADVKSMWFEAKPAHAEKGEEARDA